MVMPRIRLPYRQTVICMLLLLLMSVLSPLASAAEMVASVDRTEVGRNDAVTLQIHYSDMAGFGSPDWSVLDKDWDIIDQNQSQQMQFGNTGKNSSTDWTLTLIPRRTGNLQIPVIEYRGSKTQVINIKVSDQATTAPSSTDNFYFEVEVSGGIHYVQEQILYIERLYYTVNHDDANLSEMSVADARLVQLTDPKQYITVVDGKRVGVYERRFAIFPEQAGTLVIPGQRFSGRITNRYDRFRGQTETVVSKPIRIDVQPIPAEYPTAPWIPASQFNISEHFSSDFSRWQAGEPVTRTITISANGLSSGQIPPIPMPEVANLRYYPDQTKDDSKTSEDGLTTTVTQSVALVPTQSGDLSLPEIRVPWWNTLENRVEYATLPARTVKVKAAAAAAKPLSGVTGSLPAEVPQASAETAAENSQNTTDTIISAGYWPIVAGVLLLTNLLTLIALLLRKPESSEETGTGSDAQAQSHSKELRKTLKKACTGNDPAAIRTALLNWVRASTGETMASLTDVGNYFADPRLSGALAELDAVLYSGQNNSAFNGQSLWTLLEQAEKTRNSRVNESDVLPGLYPGS